MDHIILSDEGDGWIKENGIVRFSLSSNGRLGSAWIEHFTSTGHEVSSHARRILLSSQFVPTDGISFDIAVVMGLHVPESNRLTPVLLEKGKELKLRPPTPEIICLIRDKFSDQAIDKMTLECIVGLHEQIEDQSGFLDTTPGGIGVGELTLPEHRWGMAEGFAFIDLMN